MSDKGFIFSGLHYEESIDAFIKLYYENSYCCVLFDLSDYIAGATVEEVKDFRRRYWLEDITMSDLLHCDSCVLEFETKGKMEEYLYEISDGFVYARFYSKGYLHEEITDTENK